MSDTSYPPQDRFTPSQGDDPTHPPASGEQASATPAPGPSAAGYPYPSAGDTPLYPPASPGAPSAWPPPAPPSAYPGAPSAPPGAAYNPYAGPPSGNYPPYPGGPQTTPLGYPPAGYPPAPGYGPPSVPLGAPPSAGLPPQFAPAPPQRKGLGAGAIVGIVVGSILLVCIGLCALGLVVNALTTSRGSRSPFVYNTPTPLPTDTPFSFYSTPTPDGDAFPTATAAPVHIPPVPANCCFNMVLGTGYGNSGTELYITGRTNNFYAGGTFAFVLNLNGHSITGANKPAGSTSFWFDLLRPNGSGGEYVVNKLPLTVPNATPPYTEYANSTSIINVMQQNPPGQYKAEFVTSDGSTYLGAAIFDYFG